MVLSHEIQPSLQKILHKLSKKDKKTYEIIMAKIQEILTRENIHHYKNLKKPLQHLKRAHIHGSFVLAFGYNSLEDKVVFYAFDHHDAIYQA